MNSCQEAKKIVPIGHFRGRIDVPARKMHLCRGENTGESCFPSRNPGNALLRRQILEESVEELVPGREFLHSQPLILTMRSMVVAFDGDSGNSVARKAGCVDEHIVGRSEDMVGTTLRPGQNCATDFSSDFISSGCSGGGGKPLRSEPLSTISNPPAPIEP